MEGDNMNYIINQRFINELFEQKKVTCNCTMYNQLFPYIWPCEAHFKDFLKASDNSLKLEYAKKIYLHIQAIDDIFLPNYLVNNVVSSQFENLVVKEGVHIPQDHVIHSITLYILGIYLFFNYPPFYEKLTNSENYNSTADRIKSFIRKWRAFAFYHDVGYYLEQYVEKDGSSAKTKDIETQYKNIYSPILFNYLVRSLARLIIATKIFKNKHNVFTPEKYSHLSCYVWNDISGKPVNFTTIESFFTEYNSAIFVEGIHSDVEMKHFESMLSKGMSEKYLCIIHNENNLPIAFIERTGSEIKRIYSLIGIKTDISNLIYSNDLSICFPNCRCDFYINDVEKYLDVIVENTFNGTYLDIYKSFFDKLPPRLKLEFDITASSHQITNTFTEINDWIISECQMYSECHPSDLKSYVISNCYKDSIKSCLEKKVGELIGDVTLSSNNFSKHLLLTSKKLKNKSQIKKLISDIEHNANMAIESKSGNSYDIIDFLENTRKVYEESFYSSKQKRGSFENYLKSMDFVKIAGNRIILNPFSHSLLHEKTFEMKLYDSIEKCANVLNVGLANLSNYKTDYTSCDHGIVSAALLFQAVSFCNYIITRSQKQSIINFAFYGISDLGKFSDGILINDFSKVIFSVLIHNIYTREARPYGIDYKHNFSKDPFSYFCAFCDTLQKWGRPKQLNQAYVCLPKNSFLSAFFDIIINDNIINIQCAYDDIVELKSTIAFSEKYLPGISQIVSVNENDFKTFGVQNEHI